MRNYTYNLLHNYVLGKAYQLRLYRSQFGSYMQRNPKYDPTNSIRLVLDVGIVNGESYQTLTHWADSLLIGNVYPFGTPVYINKSVVYNAKSVSIIKRLQS